jgi:hypothetical protein
VSVTIENPTDHRLYIKATTPDDASSSYVTIVPPRTTKTTHDVVDRGERWVLNLRTLGASAGTVDAERGELVDGSFTIPLSVNALLAADGVPVDVDDASEG